MESLRCLEPDEVTSFLASSPGWEARDRGIVRSFVFEDYPSAVAFVVRVAMRAECENHHPDLTLSWRKVTVFLTTHDAGGLTARDTALARAIDRLA